MLKSLTDLSSKLFKLWVGGILCENFPTAAGQKRATLKGFVLESSKLMELMMTNIGASIHHGCSQSIIAIRDCTKICKKLKGTLQVVSHSALHGPLSSRQVFPNEMHQWAKSLLLVWPTRNIWALSKPASFVSCRARITEKEFFEGIIQRFLIPRRALER